MSVSNRSGLKLILLVGVAAVLGAGSFVLHGKASATQQCPANAQQYECWQQHILDALAAGGLSKAMREFDSFFSETTSFNMSCHDLAHLLGRAGYAEFKKGGSITYSPIMETCSFGFFHGFLEALIADTGSLQRAADFCAKMQGNVPDDAQFECYHGIGHGIVDGYDASVFKDIPAAVAKGIATCSAFGQWSVACAGGVFNGTANVYYFGYYGITLTDAQAPFSICRAYSGIVGDECYNYMVHLIFHLSSGTFASDLRLFMSLVPKQFQASAILYLATLYTAEPNHSADDVLAECGRLPVDLASSCVSGYSRGLIKVETPALGVSDMRAFCARLPSGLKSGCFLSALHELRIHISATEARTMNFNGLCAPLAGENRDACESALAQA